MDEGNAEISGGRIEERRWQRIARFRFGNEMMERRYWEEENRKMCQLCRGQRETWDHKCKSWRERIVGRKRVKRSWEERERGKDG